MPAANTNIRWNYYYFMGLNDCISRVVRMHYRTGNDVRRMDHRRSKYIPSRQRASESRVCCSTLCWFLAAKLLGVIFTTVLWGSMGIASRRNTDINNTIARLSETWQLLLNSYTCGSPISVHLSQVKGPTTKAAAYRVLTYISRR